MNTTNTNTNDDFETYMTQLRNEFERRSKIEEPKRKKLFERLTYEEVKEVYQRYMWVMSMTDSDGIEQGLEWLSEDYGLNEWFGFEKDVNELYPNLYNELIGGGVQ